MGIERDDQAENQVAVSDIDANLPFETDLRKRASPLASAAHWRRWTDR